MRSVLGVDALSAWFAVPVLVVGGLGSIFATAYWPARRHPRNGRRLHFCYGLLLASLVFILLARDGTSFLIAWEVMALTNFFLVTIEENDAEVRRAGWLYLLYSHVTILGLFAFFMLQHQLTGALGFERIAAAAPAGARTRSSCSRWWRSASRRGRCRCIPGCRRRTPRRRATSRR